MKNLKDKLVKFYQENGKFDRYEGRGNDYFNCVINSAIKDCNELGEVWISCKDSCTGENEIFYCNK